jgi:hypothetical protein
MEREEERWEIEGLSESEREYLRTMHRQKELSLFLLV